MSLKAHTLTRTMWILVLERRYENDSIPKSYLFEWNECLSDDLCVWLCVVYAHRFACDWVGWQSIWKRVKLLSVVKSNVLSHIKSAAQKTSRITLSRIRYYGIIEEYCVLAIKQFSLQYCSSLFVFCFCLFAHTLLLSCLRQRKWKEKQCLREKKIYENGRQEKIPDKSIHSISPLACRFTWSVRAPQSCYPKMRCSFFS